MPSKPPDIAFFAPCIPGNTGAAIRLCAVTGSTLHLIKPLGFELTDTKLKRSGLDYHDLANVKIYENFDEFKNSFDNNIRIFAFTCDSRNYYQNIKYDPTDILLFGPEPTGLPKEVSQDKRIENRLRLPMRPALRSLNLANTASIALYEAWRQLDFIGGV